ncbi:MAG TPA: metalloregulator ArsR/SmtB family transcription factor [Methylomirabilota bacterium]|nr:metalloregulator ArsR/SmtB family transcription factor [Methylomirabilota bacterium]
MEPIQQVGRTGRVVGERERGTRCCDVVPGPGMDGEAIDRVSADLELLAHPVRLRLLELLVRRGGEVCVCDLERVVPVKQPTVSHHLRLLREAGWVETVRKGIWAYYFARPEVLAAVRERVSRAMGALA